MRIIKLTAENVKRLRAVEITPDGDMVVVSGRNGQGKSSVLDAIWFALGGKAASRDTTRPVRDGADRATVTLDLGDMVVTRTWSSDTKSTLTVTAPDGSKYSSPQSVLDGLVGRLSFDPLTFTGLPPKEQRQQLLNLMDLPFDLQELEAQRLAIFQSRTEVNRDVKALEARFSGMSVSPAGTPADEVSATDVLKSIRNAQDWQRHAKTKRMNLQAKRDQIADLERVLKVARTDLEILEVEVSDLPHPLPDPSAYEAQLEELEVTNTNVRARKARAALEEELVVERSKADRLTAAIAELDKEKAMGLGQATLPVDGLGFDENGITFWDIPLQQASSAEQLRVSVAIAMAANPSLRVLRITDGSLLDSTSMAIIAEMSAEHDFQCWIERVDETGSVGVVIEDGEVVARGDQ